MITVDNLTKTYGSHIALDNISFSVPDGSICAIVGPNGAGKSTLLKILTRILKCDSGTIAYNPTLPTNLYNQKIAYLPEQRGLYTGVDIETQLVFFAEIRGLNKKQARENVNYWLKRFGIDSWRFRHVSELSKGMQQKVQFISCLVSNPSLMFMDEPFSGVDPVNFKLFAEILLEYQKEHEATVVLSTHNMKSVEELCSDVVIIKDGKIEISGNVNEVKQAYSKGNSLLLDVNIGDNFDCVNGICSKLNNKFHIITSNVDQGHLFVEIVDSSLSNYSKSMQNALQTLEEYDVYQCSRRVMSMEEIFIELNKR